jgi:hypothetical protein
MKTIVSSNSYEVKHSSKIQPEGNIVKGNRTPIGKV